MEGKNKYLVEITFRAVLRGDTEADAIYGVGGSLKYGFGAGEDVKNVGIKIVRKERAETEKPAIDEAPFADQVTEATTVPVSALRPGVEPESGAGERVTADDIQF